MSADGERLWQAHAACRGMDVETFFHPDGERTLKRAARIAAATAICGGCRVRPECREWAHTAHEPFGVWGGESEDDRREARRAIRRRHSGP